MNLAFSAVLLLFIFTPGIALRRGYLSYPFSRRFSASSPTDEVVLSVVPAVPLHLGMIELVSLLGYRIDWPVLGTLLSGAKEDAFVAEAFQNVGEHLFEIAAYNFSLWAVAFAIGCVARWIVLDFELDRALLLRFNNDWYYLLTGRQWWLSKYDFVWIDVLVGDGDKAIVYSGIFDDFFFARDGSLDRLSIRLAQRISLENAGDPSRAGRDEGLKSGDSTRPAASMLAPPITFIPGQALIIKYTQVVNLNIAFYNSTVSP